MVSVNVLLFVVPHAIHVTNPNPNPNPNPKPKLKLKPILSPNPNPNLIPNQVLYEIRIARRLTRRFEPPTVRDLLVVLAACGWYVTPALIIRIY